MISPVEAWTARCIGLPDPPEEALEAWQMARLRRVLARERGRFYGERLWGVDPETLATRADLQRLPFTHPRDLARDALGFLAVPQREVARVTTLATSGTHGAPKRVFFTREDLLRTVSFFREGMKTLAGPGDRVLILMPGRSEHSIGRLLRTALEDLGARGDLGDPATVEEALQAARGAACIVGLPAQILRLCRTEPGLRPRTVLLSADFAPPSLVRAIGELWRCEVVTHYGLTETGYGCAVQCPAREGHHLRDAELILEIVDPDTGIPVGPGLPGEIVLTTLAQEAMPLLRYRTGDLGRRILGPCPCGGILPRLGRVEGRLSNRLPLGEGRTLSIHDLDERIFALPGVRAFEAELHLGGGRPVLRLAVDSEEPVEEALGRDPLLSGLDLRVDSTRSLPFPVKGKRRLLLR